jgi:hypothetical protein
MANRGPSRPSRPVVDYCEYCLRYMLEMRDRAKGPRYQGECEPRASRVDEAALKRSRLETTPTTEDHLGGSLCLILKIDPPTPLAQSDFKRP